MNASSQPVRLITPSCFLKQLPRIARRIPRMLLGLYFSSIGDQNKPISLGWAIERAARRYPDRPAILEADRQLSYAQFNAGANRMARALKDQGVRQGSTVLVMIENRIELLLALAAIAKLGAVSAILNTAQKSHVLQHSIVLIQASHAIIGAEAASNFQESANSSSMILLWVADVNDRDSQRPTNWLDLLALSQHQNDSNLDETRQVRLQDPCFYIYTSGSTGLPKASILSHRKWIKAYGGFGHAALGLTCHDVLYLTLPCYHNNAVTVCWSAALAGGAALALRRRFSRREFWSDIRRYRATCFGYIGELCLYLLNQPPCPEERDNTLTSMIGNGLRPAIWTTFKHRFGIERVAEFYASSEGNIGFTNVFNFDHTVGYSPARYAIVRYDPETVTPVRNAQGRMERVGRGEAGLMLTQITPKWPFDGYTDPEKSEASILRDVFKKGDAWFNTCDLMRDIGLWHTQFVDRLGDTFRWKGENVSTTEVENTLVGFSGIQEAIVYGVEIPGCAGRCGMASLIVDDGFDLQQLQVELTRCLPSYAIPVFIRLLPSAETTGTFKYQKTALKKTAFDPSATANSPIFVKTPGNRTYQPLDAGLFDRIQQGDIPF